MENKSLGVGIRKSKNPYKCDHCYLEIPKEVLYISLSGICDGEFYKIRSHVECSKKYREINKDSESVEDNILLEEIDELNQPISFTDWCEFIRENYNLVEETK